MKRVKNLWSEFISPENLDVAARAAVRGKGTRCSAMRFLDARDDNLARLRDALENNTFSTGEYRTRKVYEPKERTIYILPLYPDHVVHHALINVLGPIWQRMFIRDSYACIPGRGIHAASRRIMEFIRRNKYVLQCDIRKFYPSINHDVMMDILHHKIGDPRILAVLENIVRSVPGDTNIPIGSLTSQWLGNVYMNELDHYVKETLRIRDYIRYCDDFCIFGNNRRELQSVAEHIRTFIGNKLRLTFSMCEIYPTTQGVNFIGYRHFRRFILLRRTAARRVRRRLANIARFHDRSPRAESQVAAAYGWVRHASSYNFRRRIFRDVPMRRKMYRRVFNV